MKIVLLSVALIGILGVFFVFYIVMDMLLIGTKTEAKLQRSKIYEPILHNIEVNEISGPNEPILQYEYKPGTGDFPGSEEVTLLKDGTIKEEPRFFDSDPGVSTQVLNSYEGSAPLIFDASEIYTFENNKLSEKLGEFSNPKIQYVGFAIHINEDYFLMDAKIEAPEGYPVNSKLFQVSRKDFSKTIITEDLHFTFIRPTKVFKSSNFKGVIAVYYTGSWNYGFGGDSSRPEWSVIRIYNDQFPAGRDIVKMGFLAGTIVDVKYECDSIILRGDPSRPRQSEKPPTPSRLWRVSLPN